MDDTITTTNDHLCIVELDTGEMQNGQCYGLGDFVWEFSSNMKVMNADIIYIVWQKSILSMRKTDLAMVSPFKTFSLTPSGTQKHFISEAEAPSGSLIILWYSVAEVAN
jgi:hypothetical protein